MLCLSAFVLAFFSWRESEVILLQCEEISNQANLQEKRTSSTSLPRRAESELLRLSCYRVPVQQMCECNYIWLSTRQVDSCSWSQYDKAQSAQGKNHNKFGPLDISIYGLFSSGAHSVAVLFCANLNCLWLIVNCSCTLLIVVCIVNLQFGTSAYELLTILWETSYFIIVQLSLYLSQTGILYYT